MGSVRARDGKLLLDFRFKTERFREQTLLSDTPANRKKLHQVLQRIEAEITLGSFDYAVYFPHSPRVEKFKQLVSGMRGARMRFEDFVNTWWHQREPTWRAGTLEYYKTIVFNTLVPEFGTREVSSISKADVLNFRASIAKSSRKLSESTINRYVKTLLMILKDAADQLDFKLSLEGIKPLRVKKVDVQPFSLEEVNGMLQVVRPDWRVYLMVRFFTGLRTGEINGLPWKHVDFDNNLIRVRQTLFRLKVQEGAKNNASLRDIHMSSMVKNALLEHQRLSGGSGDDLVFTNSLGKPIDQGNFERRVWRPLLNLMGMEYRRPYQTRHTAATLWLASGENPNWIASQMGHVDTTMLFKVYSRYVPNMTRQDGSAMERLLAGNIHMDHPVQGFEAVQGLSQGSGDQQVDAMGKTPRGRYNPGNFTKSSQSISDEALDQLNHFDKLLGGV